MKKARCKDCPADSKRPAPHPGPRCTTHHRAVLKARRTAAHDARVQEIYGLAPGEYALLYAYQGEMCFLCRRAKGIRKRLAVDHNHQTDEVRGLLCTPCNKLLGHARDLVEFFERCIEYLKDPPARRMREGR